VVATAVTASPPPIGTAHGCRGERVAPSVPPFIVVPKNEQSVPMYPLVTTPCTHWPPLVDETATNAPIAPAPLALVKVKSGFGPSVPTPTTFADEPAGFWHVAMS